MKGIGTVQKIAGWIALAAYLLAGIVPFSGFVLCVEPDGCVSLETTGEGSGCGPCPKECSVGVGNGLASSLTSPTCTDIPLLSAQAQVNSKLARVSLPNLDVAVRLTLEEQSSRSAPLRPESRGLVVCSRASALVQQRTIVLRV